MPDSATLAEINEAVYRKALEQITRIQELTAGKSAADLRREVVAKAKEEKAEMDSL